MTRSTTLHHIGHHAGHHVRHHIGRHIGLVAIATLVMTACSSAASDDAESALGEVPERASVDAERPEAEADIDADADAETVLVGETGAEPAATDEVAGAAEADAENSAAESAEQSAPADAAEAPASEGGGLFDDDGVAPDVDSSRLDDNEFADYGYRDFIDTDDDPLSTFALDVDTGSYTITRQWLDEGVLPPAEAVRPEEYINAFRYDYRAPRRGLELSVDGGPSPFDRDKHLVRIGVQGEEVEPGDRPPAALTFVVDTSGSMDRDDRLGLVKRALATLVDELDDDDTVAIVTYDDNAGVVLEPTPVDDRDEILDAIDRLQPGGSTNLEAGLRSGYELADAAFREGGINRVVLASDGVANVGVTDPDALAAMIHDDAERGIDLVTVGFGMGNYNDVTMEQLADQGDGFYAYVDTDEEAERLFEEQLTSTLLTIAKNAKIQVEFDPEAVRSYRLIGFENRGVLDSDFENDRVDAGELGAGHQVTAIYELELAGDVDPARRSDRSVDLGTVTLRWEDPADGDIDEIDDEIEVRDIETDWSAAADDFRLATVVATFAEVMRDSPFADSIELDDLAEEADVLAEEFGTDEVDDLVRLIERASELR